MREMTKHAPGRIFIAVLAITLLFILFVLPFIASSKYLFFGWIPTVWFACIMVLVVWAVACGIYLYRYWPYKDI